MRSIPNTTNYRYQANKTHNKKYDDEEIKNKNDEREREKQKQKERKN